MRNNKDINMCQRYEKGVIVSCKTEKRTYIWQIFPSPLEADTSTSVPIGIFIFWRLKSKQILAGLTWGGTNIHWAEAPGFSLYAEEANWNLQAIV
jgi:hypothetical protein